jgi:hypothetical protein
MGTQVNIQLLLEKLRGSKKRDGDCCLFIDYKSAYNSICRERLYRALIRKNILEQDEVNFLRAMH